MCGIFAVFNVPGDVQKFRQRALELSKKLRHRGPDWSGTVVAGKNILCHERLSIVGVDTGAQPLSSEDGSVVLSVNGEIYNHRKLAAQLVQPHTFKTHSDCEVILHLYEECQADVVGKLDGMFAFVLLDTRNGERFIAARDPIGITTLYQGTSSVYPGAVFFASELKALNEDCDRIWSFPPGHYYDSLTGETRRYFNPQWLDPKKSPTNKANCRELRLSLEAAVRKRLMAEVPYGVLLSGGLDSSLIASIAAREVLKANAGGNEPAGSGSANEVPTPFSSRLHTFSIGLKGSPDLEAARIAAKFIGSVHHEFTFTIQEGLDAVADVIYSLETYDVTTVRASTPMYLLSRKIKALGIKMVLSGEGSDEVFGGYLYFHAAPSAEAFHEETVNRVKNLHTADCLRANKSTMAWGLEARVPFLDTDFLKLAMSIDPHEKLFGDGHPGSAKMEKSLLRRAFDVREGGGAEGEDPYLPDSILWRQKEQFSDGVGYGWIDALRDNAVARVDDAAWEQRACRWPVDTPETKEAYLYRQIFESHFPQPACAESVVRWVPRADWGCPSDPSGRAQKVHADAYVTMEKS